MSREARLLRALHELEKAVFHEYGLVTAMLPRTAEAVKQARVVIREVRTQGPGPDPTNERVMAPE
jgi:hypothetical protein